MAAQAAAQELELQVAEEVNARKQEAERRSAEAMAAEELREQQA